MLLPARRGRRMTQLNTALYVDVLADDDLENIRIAGGL